MAVTKEQIFAAADALAAEGKRPTLESIRQITGGSYSTISPALNEWRARQAAKASPIREAAPQAVADRMAEVGAEVWSIALELANARLAAEREALDKARGELEDERNEATELADRLAAQVEELQSRLASIEAAEQAARTEAGELRQALAEAREQARIAEARADELRAELDHAHQDAQQARDTLTAAREEAAGLRGQLEALKEQTAALLARITPAKYEKTGVTRP